MCHSHNATYTTKNLGNAREQVHELHDALGMHLLLCASAPSNTQAQSKQSILAFHGLSCCRFPFLSEG